MKNGSIYVILITTALLCVYLITLPTVKEHFIITGLKEKLTVIDPKFKDLDIRESASSYTEDKTIIFLCLRNENGEYYPMNTIIYVALHEIAHLLNKTDFGHTPEFHRIFDDLLCKAANVGIYDPSLPHATSYCGVDISGITMPTCKV